MMSSSKVKARKVLAYWSAEQNSRIDIARAIKLSNLLKEKLSDDIAPVVNCKEAESISVEYKSTNTTSGESDKGTKTSFSLKIQRKNFICSQYVRSSIFLFARAPLAMVAYWHLINY